MIFNCMKSYFIYPLNAIKFLHDEKIIKAIYTKIIKEISLFAKKEYNILFILIESFFNLLINEILSNNEIISKLNYIHIFLMNIINIMQIESKSFYVYMQFKSLYKLIKEEKNNKLLNNIYSEIFKLKSIFSSSIKKEETLEAYIQFYEKLRNDYKISNYNALRIFIVDFFTYELKKYQNEQELFPIILDVLSENNGDAFLSSKKIFNIFLEKYVFEDPPETKQECREILARTFKFELEEEEINDPMEDEKIKDIDKEGNKEKEEQNKKEVEKEQKDPINDDIMEENELIEPEEDKEEEQKIMPEIKEEIMPEFMPEIMNYDDIKEVIEPNEEKVLEQEKEEPEEEEQKKEFQFGSPVSEDNVSFESIKGNKDCFLIKYNEIATTEGKEKIKVIIDEIIQQYFGFYFNGYFMSHIGDNYEKIDFLEKNKLFLKICINFLDDLESNFKGKEISIFLANAFIQSFLYIFVNYFYNNLNDNDNFDLNGVLKIIEGNSNFKRVVQIYFFKL